MAKFRKKPIVIEARQYESDANVATVHDLAEWCGGWIVRSMDEGHIVGIGISTLEGDMRATPGDWIIKGVSGEFYPCKNDIFRKTYDPVEDWAENG